MTSSDLTFGLIFGLSAVAVCVLSAVFIVYLIDRAPIQPFDDSRDVDENEEAFVLARSRYHREALAAYHSRLCELKGVDTHSDEGEHLLHVIYNGEKL